MRSRWALAATAILAGALLSGCKETPTARVVEARTGRPVAGAVFVAIWWKTTVNVDKPWWEGSATVMDRFVEGTSDDEGRIMIPGFWQLMPLSKRPSLTVYKSGFVLWNQERIFPDYAMRKDFGRLRRTVELQAWEREYPGEDLESFLIVCAGTSLFKEQYMKGNRLLTRAIHDFILSNKGERR